MHCASWWLLGALQHCSTCDAQAAAAVVRGWQSTLCCVRFLLHYITNSQYIISIVKALNLQPQGAYFLGKALWDKGHRSLIALLADHDARSGGAPVHVDVYGVGEDLEGIRAEAARKQVDMEFKGLWDHIDPALQDYKVRQGALVLATKKFDARVATRALLCSWLRGEGAI